MIFKTLNELAPNYMCDNVNRAWFAHERQTRLCKSNDVILPSYNSEYGKKTFNYHCGKIWNALDENLKKCTSVFMFKKRYRRIYN